MQIVVGVAVVRGDRVLAAYRPGPEGGWEFPGGKVEPGESEPAAAARELREELEIDVEIGTALGPGVDISDKYRLHVYRAALVAGEPVRTEHSELRWFTAAELVEEDWLIPDRPFVRLLRDQL